MTSRVRQLQGRWRRPAAVGALLLALAPDPLIAQRASARYVGGTLATPRSLVQYDCRSQRGTFDLTSDAHVAFSGGEKVSITLTYESIAAITFGLETVKGGFCYPWESYQQFTKKRHYLLTVNFRDAGGEPQAVVFEVEKASVRPVLARLESRTGLQVEFTNAVACLEYATADACGHGQPAELKGLTTVYIDTGTAMGGVSIENKERALALRDRLATEIAGANLGLSILKEATGAEIVLAYRRETVAETRAGGFYRGKLTEAGRGEVHVVHNGRRRVVLMFEDIKTSPLERDPATNFVQTFIDAYRKAGLR